MGTCSLLPCSFHLLIIWVRICFTVLWCNWPYHKPWTPFLYLPWSRKITNCHNHWTLICYPLNCLVVLTNIFYKDLLCWTPKHRKRHCQRNPTLDATHSSIKQNPNAVQFSSVTIKVCLPIVVVTFTFQLCGYGI